MVQSNWQEMQSNMNFPIMIEEEHLVDNDFARSFVIFGVNNGSSSHTNNQKITFYY